LWLHPAPPTGSENGGAAGDAPADQDSEHKAREAAQKRRRYRAQRIVPEEKKDGMLMVFRAESLFTWDEYVKVNRHNDEDDDEDNAAAAEAMNKLSVATDSKTRGSRLKFDLDLPSAEYDDTPLGPGLLLPEWDWKRQRLIDDHCRLLPMRPRDASPAPLPDRLLPLARRLRRQFQALAPERTRKSGETNGPDIDLDRVIRFMAERQGGVAQGEPALYQAWPPGERNLACLLLADLSLSTESWVGEAGRVIDVIKDSLLLFAEALSASGDAFGLYGFSSLKRHEVRYLLLKDFAEAFDDAARGRMLGLVAKAEVAVLNVADPLELAQPPAGRYPFAHRGVHYDVVLQGERQREDFARSLGEGHRRLTALCTGLGLRERTLDTSADPLDAIVALLGARTR